MAVGEQHLNTSAASRAVTSKVSEPRGCMSLWLQVPYAAPNGVIPFNPGTPAPGAPMQPGFMMFPGQAAAMGPQGMMPAYGFPPAMAPVPMVPQTPQQQQQGAHLTPSTHFHHYNPKRPELATAHMHAHGLVLLSWRSQAVLCRHITAFSHCLAQGFGNARKVTDEWQEGGVWAGDGG